MSKVFDRRRVFIGSCVLASMVLSALIWLIQPALEVRAATHDQFKTAEVIVRLSPVSSLSIDAINADYGTSTISALAGISDTYRLHVPVGQDAATLVNNMAKDHRLLYANLNFVRAPPEADPRSIGAWGGLDSTPYFTQYVSSTLALSIAHAINTGSGSVVAIIDTGVQLTHPALIGKWTAARYDFVDNDDVPEDIANNLDDDGDGLIDEAWGHGTHVAGIVALVAPDAKLMPLRALNADGSGDDATIANAIDYAVAHGANVINLSLGTADHSDMLEDAIQHATQAGVVVVSAAGNADSPTIQFPAGNNCSLAVTSVDPNDVKSGFSNYGSWVDVSAPGEEIYSMMIPDGYAWWTGTSMATPLVAGQAALIHSLRPTLNPREIAAIVAITAQSIDSQNPQFHNNLGKGRIDIGASLTWLTSGQILPDIGGLLSGGCVSEVAATTTPTQVASATATPTNSVPATATPGVLTTATSTSTAEVTANPTPLPTATPSPVVSPPLLSRVFLPLLKF